MLSHCCACVVARTDERSRLIESIARQVGFAFVSSTVNQPGSGAAAPEHPVLYFLMDSEVEDAAMRHTLGALRRSPAARLCYAPVILFVPDGPIETYLHYVRMGFDDVITIPEQREILVRRLDSQLGEHLYFRTPTYLGPDRRRFDLMSPGQERRSSGSSDHDELTLIRSVLGGIEVVRVKQFIGGDHLQAAS